jgi:SAM-dependent methyltransferase
MTDPSPAMLRAAHARAPGARVLDWQGETLPFEAGRADLAISAGILHAVNDPVGHLVQLNHALAPDGLMIAVFAGGQTLSELRVALAEAEAEVSGGLSPRVAPMGEIRELGALLQRAGFAMPVADTERFTLSYESPLHLMRELRAMGETSILAGRRRGLAAKALMARAAEIYAHHFPAPDQPGRVRATVDLVFLTGWSPGPGQPKPLRPGSAKTRLADALGTAEQSAGEKAGRS